MMSSIMTKIWNIFSVQIQNIATRLTQDHKLWYSINNSNILKMAGVAELADALDLGSNGTSCAGSSPVARTIKVR